MSIPPDTVAVLLADDATSSMLEEEKRNKNVTNDIGIQAFYAVLQLGEGYQLIALLTFAMQRVGAESIRVGLLSNGVVI
jgi:hypothetical protein